MKSKYGHFLFPAALMMLGLLFFSVKKDKQDTSKAIRKESADSIQKIEDTRHRDSVNIKYSNEIHADEIPSPCVGYFIRPDKLDTLDFDIKGEYFFLFVKGKPQIKLKFIYAISLIPYREGDLNGDGIEDFGLLPGYRTGSSRVYEAYTIKNGSFVRIASALTHMPDRIKGVDYFKKEGDKLRVISAISENCSQCEGNDTIFIDISR